MARIFLCHASEDKPQVRDAYQRLKALGFEPWLDEEDLVGGQLWEREIPRALQASDFIVIFFSQHSIRKIGYVQNEFKLALETWRLIPEGTIHTIPVRLDTCEVPGEFRRFQWIDLFDDRGFERVLRAIRFGLSQRQRAEPAARLEESTEPAQGVITPTPPQNTPVVKEILAEAAREAAPTTHDLALQLTNSIGMEFVLVPAGTFLMGSPDSDAEAHDDEKPAHRVTISRPFYLGKYAVTQGQWEAVMGTNPSTFRGDPNRPVECVSWAATLSETLSGASNRKLKLLILPSQ